jgi:hypothetical protein
LTDIDEVESPSDLVWLPHLSEEPITEYTTATGKTFRPVGKNKRVWRLVEDAGMEGS